MPGSEALRETIRESYPFPISHAFTYLESRVDANDRYQALLACFEVALKTLAAISLANFMRDIQDDPGLGNVSLFQYLLDTLNRPLSLGHWQELLRRTSRPYATHRERLVVPELFDFYYRVTQGGNIKTQSQNVRLLQRFIEERNEEAHHRNRSQTSPFQRQSQLPELEDSLQTLLGKLQFLGQYPWLYVEHAEHHEGQWRYRANYAQGANYPFHQQTWETSLSISSRRCLVVNESKSAVLELDPFVIVTSEGRLQQSDLFFFDGVFSSGRANFMNYHVGDYVDPIDEGSPASVASDAVNSLIKLLKNRIPPATEEGQDLVEGRLSAVEVYRRATNWALQREERQVISLDALRKILNLSREEALQLERELEAERGVEIETEVEVPFEGEPTWANLAYYVLDNSGQTEMFYKDIAREAEVLKDQYDPDWSKGDSAHVEGTVSRTMSQDPRFYKIKSGYYRLTKHNELLSNPSWANLAYFVLQRHDPRRRGMHLSDITERAVELKEKYSDWRSENVQTPSHTVSATMSMDHRFESMPERGYWRIAIEDTEEEMQPSAVKASSPSREESYYAVLARLREMGSVEPLPFGRTYYALNGQIHLMFRFSRAHERKGEVEYFLGVTPQYFKRIDALGNGFMVFVLGGPDNVLLVPTKVFAQWVEGLELSGSGTWPLTFYQCPTENRVQRLAPGQGRVDVTAYLNDYASLRRVLSEEPPTSTSQARTSTRVADLLEVGLLKPGKVWVEMTKLKGETLKTLAQKKPFDVVEIRARELIVRPCSTGRDRPIPREAIEGAFEELATHGEITRADIRERYSDRSPAYITALLASLPGVTFSLKPIRLRYTAERA